MTGPYFLGAVVPAGDNGEAYRLVRCIGEGASSIVYEAHDLRRGGLVVLKLLRKDAPAERMQREWAALARVRHPSVVRLLSFGLTCDPYRLAYLVMPLVGGGSIRGALDRLHGRGLGLERSVEHGRQLFEALDHIHGAGLLHRDIRPENLLLERHDAAVHRLVVVDLGLVCYAGTRLPTAQGLVGDLRYAAPDLFWGGLPSFSSDLYAAGLVLFEMLTGCHPLALASADWRDTHCYTFAPALGSLLPAAPAALSALLQALLAKHARQRPTSAAQCAQALAGIQQGLAAAPNEDITIEDGVDSLLRRLGGPTEGEATQVDPPSANLLRRASPGSDTEELAPPSSV